MVEKRRSGLAAHRRAYGSSRFNPITEQTSIVPTTYRVMYNGNTNTSGNSPINGFFSYKAGTSVTVLGNTASPLLEKAGFIFTGWNTEANGSGISYSQGDIFVINTNITLYAQWTIVPNTSPVIFRTVGTTNWTAPVDVSLVEYLVVGGGGGSGGGFDTGGGGGGGGGMVLLGTLSVNPGNVYSIVVGDGGDGGISIRSPISETNGDNGENSSFSTIVALGGGGGYASRNTNPLGSSAGGPSVSGFGPTASTGGSGGGSAGDLNGAGGGGGGNNTNGSDGVSNTGGNGGSGISTSISGSSLIYGAGGRGANGNVTIGNTAVAGASNTGNGARGGGTGSFAQTNGAKGGSGIVILKYTPSA
jgi:uncharacterized repeat protein (TIGR02543 family)